MITEAPVIVITEAHVIALAIGVGGGIVTRIVAAILEGAGMDKGAAAGIGIVVGCGAFLWAFHAVFGMWPWTALGLGGLALP